MSQTSYSQSMGENFAGMLADARDKVVESKTAEEEILFGYGVCAGATDAENGVKLPDADTEVFRGIAIHEHNEDGKYPANSTVNVLRRGECVVVTADAVVLDAAAYIVATTGKFTDSGAGNIATGGKFKETVDAAGLARVEINLP